MLPSRFQIVLTAILYCLSCLSFAGVSPIVTPNSPITVAILAYQPKPLILERWKPIAGYLESSLHRPVTLSVMDYDELNDVVTKQNVDVVITNPGHYVLLNHKGLVKSPLATLINQIGPIEVQEFGGVIFARSNSTIDSLTDLAGKRIAFVGTDSLGGYQMQAFELKKLGINLEDDPSLMLKTGMPHDSVVDTVISGKADVGFVRDGVIERLIKSGKITNSQIRIINRQQLNGFPYAVSTPLYPEWPITITNRVNEKVARALTVALLSLQANNPAAISAAIHGFNAPADYSGVEEVLRELRLPPFDVIPKFTLKDFWNRNFIAVNTIISVFVIIILTVLGVLYRQFVAARQSRNRFATLFDLSPEPIWLLKDGLFLDCNGAAYSSLGFGNKKAMVGKSLLEFSPDYQPNGLSSASILKTIQQTAIEGNQQFDWTFRTQSRNEVIFKISLAPIILNGSRMTLAVGHDLSESIKNYERTQLSSSVFLQAKEGILITSPAGEIIEVNQALIDTSGYSREELIGSNPRIFQSGIHPNEFYSNMWSEILGKGYWTGEITNKRKDGALYPGILTISSVKDVYGKVSNFVGHFTDITHIKNQEAELKSLAFYDPLTGLPNRRLLQDRLTLALSSGLRRGHKGALLFLDLDNFKTINDTLGHDIGDLLLQQTAQRIQTCLREGDTVARSGGDEYVVILSDLSEEVNEAAAQTESVGKKILAALNKPYQLSKHECRCSASIGVTLFRGHQVRMDELFKQADIAMYQAKKAGRNALRFYDPEMQSAINTRVTLENELRNAIEMQQFQLYFQVQVDSSRRPLGAEALIRWQHPEQGIVSPAAFIPLAEETGLIIPIGQWVLDTACAQLKAWQLNALTQHLTLSVNVSAKQFHEPTFVAKVQNAIERHSIDPKMLKLEPTESILLEDIDETVATMTALKALGVRFALDDFGTGFSSLQYLKKLPLNQLKIDQSFVRDLVFDANDQAIVRTIIAMAQSLNLEVIAEGVETEQQQLLLQGNGCNHYQGYLFGKPVPIEEFEADLARLTVRL